MTLFNKQNPPSTLKEAQERCNILEFELSQIKQKIVQAGHPYDSSSGTYERLIGEKAAAESEAGFLKHWMKSERRKAHDTLEMKPVK